MNPDSVCPKCGAHTLGGLCPACGFFPASPSDTGNKPAGNRSLKVLLIAGAIYLLASAALLVFVGNRISGFIKQRMASGANVRQPAYPRHIGPVARLDELKGNGRVYLVQVGEHKDPYSLEDLAQWLRTKYALDVRILPAIALDKSAWDATRKQFVAESIYTQLKRENPALAADPGAYLFGFTEVDMYSNHIRWNSTFTQRDGERAAIISSDGMQDDPFQRRMIGAAAANQHFQARLRRILLKDVAILYWHLSVNNDRSSLLHNTLDPDLQSEDIYESDLDPALNPKGQTQSEPCVYFDYSAHGGMKPLPGDLIRDCSDVQDPEEDETRERFEVDLRLGLLIDKHTDFYLPDAIPIQFQRVTRDGWKGSNPFGISGTDNYDEFLSSPDNITISVVHADGGRDALVKEPRWQPLLALAKYVDIAQPGYYEMRWYSSPYEHYDLKRFDGTVKAYLPCNSPTVFCYLTGLHNPQGQSLKFERDNTRRLIRLVSQGQSWIRISYSPVGHIVEITDSRDRTVHYGYDERNRLTSVTYPSGEVFHYEYDDAQHLLTFSVSPDAKKPSRVLMRNEYLNGLLVKQTLADGSIYTYLYAAGEGRPIRSAVVKSPDGRVYNLTINDSYSSVREKKTPPESAGDHQVASNRPVSGKVAD